LRTKHDTPKYGLIYHASLVGLASSKLKGKISRSLAAKCALCIRVDALGENTDGKIGENTKTALEARIKQLEKGIPFTSKGPGMGKKLRNTIIGKFALAESINIFSCLPLMRS